MRPYNVHTPANRIILSFPWILLILLLVPAPLWAATLSFQNGVSPDASYAGTEDTYIYAQNKNTNYGGEQGLGVSGIGPSRRSSILRWDISAIPSSAVVTGAEITVVVGDPSSETYNIYEMKRPWVESGATWNVYSTGNPWEIAGASGALDRGAIVLGTTTTGTVSGKQTYTLNPNGVALVQKWVTDSTSNLGIIIQNYNNTDLLTFSSSEEATNMAKRPLLTVTYETGAVSGKVYHDANRNKAFDGTEVGLSGVTVALWSMLDNTLVATAITSADGSYSFTGIANGSYELRETNLPDYVSITPDTLAVTLSNGETLTGYDFGDFAGVKITGMVFSDTGTGGGTPNNGIQDGAEVGIVGVAVKVTDITSSITYDQTVTGMGGAYTLWVATSIGTTVVVQETNPANFISMTLDTISLAVLPGDDLPNNSFGDVPPLLFTPDGSRTVSPGGVASYAHTLTAGTTGQITLSTTTTAGLFWTFYKDTNGNGQLDGGEPVLTNADLNLTAGQTLMLISRAIVPTETPLGTIDVTVLTADQSLINSPLMATQTVTDTTTIAPDNLKLTKSASVTSAKPGDIVDYTLTYQNIGVEPLTAIVIYDYLSEYVTFNSAVPPLDPDFPDASGLMRWTIPGTLESGEFGSVDYAVTVK